MNLKRIPKAKANKMNKIEKLSLSNNHNFYLEEKRFLNFFSNAKSYL